MDKNRAGEIFNRNQPTQIKLNVPPIRRHIRALDHARVAARPRRSRDDR